MSTPTALRQSFPLRLTSAGFLAFWCLLASFPLFWIMVMSFKEPVDAFASNPLAVIFGPDTRANGKGLSILDIAAGVVLLWFTVPAGGSTAARRRCALFTPGPDPARMDRRIAPVRAGLRRGLFSSSCRRVLGVVNSVTGPFGVPVIGLTTEHYRSVWVENEFYRNFVNSMIVTTGVVAVSLTVGTLAGYGLARSHSDIAFWLLILALVFRALPHSVLVAGYLPVFVNSAEILSPILGDTAPTLYGKPYAVIAVLVSINQPFTIWMLRSFFQNIPADLDEAARVDGCTHFQAFRWVIMPVMWPGVITTGLFSFLLAYNDLLVTSLLLDAQNQTMVPAIVGYFNRETTTTDQVEAIAAAVSITAPLFLLVMVFQRQIVSGLTAGAVKG